MFITMTDIAHKIFRNLMNDAMFFSNWLKEMLY